MQGDAAFALCTCQVALLRTCKFTESNLAEPETGTAPEFSVSWSDYASTTSDHTWTLADLQVLHELRTPIFVVVPGIIESSHRYSSSRSHARDCRAAATIARALLSAVRVGFCTLLAVSSRMQSL